MLLLSYFCLVFCVVKKLVHGENNNYLNDFLAFIDFYLLLIAINSLLCFALLRQLLTQGIFVRDHCLLIQLWDLNGVFRHQV